MRPVIKFSEAVYIKHRILVLLEKALPMERLSVDLDGDYVNGYWLTVTAKVAMLRTSSRTRFSAAAFHQHEATDSEEYLRVAAFEAIALLMRERCFRAWHHSN